MLGANGAGKSTLLRVAATVARADGTVEVGGIDAAREPERARRGLVHLGQEAPAYGELSPREHLRWWARVQPDCRAGPDEALAAAGLSHALDVPARALSRGMRQRLALAMALLPRRGLLLLDEPFTGLDARGRSWLEAELQARRGGQAMLVALHDPAQARALADRVVRLEGGRLEGAA